MIPNDENPETRAIGLDVSRLVGKDRQAIDLMLGADLVLVLPANGVPPGWPPEILEREFDKERGLHLLSWQFQLSDGSWTSYYSYGRPDRSVLDTVPALIYIRRPRATQEVLVRPIAEVYFDDQGRCAGATAKMSEFKIRNHLQFRRIASLLEAPGPQTLSPIENTSRGEPRSELLALLGLAAPARMVEVRDVAWASRPGPPRHWIASCGLEVLMRVDATFTQRLSIGRDSWKEAVLRVLENERVASVTLDAAGCRLLLKDGAGTEHTRLDIYGGGIDLAVDGSDGRVWPAFLTGSSWYMPGFGDASPSLFVFARRSEEDPSGLAPRLAFNRESRRLRVLGAAGEVVDDLPALHQETEDGLFVQAPVELPPGLGDDDGGCCGPPSRDREVSS